MKIPFILFFAVLFYSCGKESSTDQSSMDPNNNLPEGLHIKFEDTPGLVKTEVRDALDRIKAIGYTMNGKKEGSWIMYGDTGLVQTLTTYVNDKKEGLFMEFNYSNQLVEQCFYHNDKRHGEYREYTNFKPKEIRFYENGKQEGMTKLFYDTGIVMEESYYKDGLRDGTCRWYDKEGRLTIEESYKKGERVTK